MQTKLQEAKAYLRSRNKYIIDPECKFKPTTATATDVSKTIAAYKKDMEAVSKRKKEEKTAYEPVVVRYIKRGE